MASIGPVRVDIRVAGVNDLLKEAEQLCDYETDKYRRDHRGVSMIPSDLFITFLEMLSDEPEKRSMAVGVWDRWLKMMRVNQGVHTKGSALMLTHQPEPAGGPPIIVHKEIQRDFYQEMEIPNEELTRIDFALSPTRVRHWSGIVLELGAFSRHSYQEVRALGLFIRIYADGLKDKEERLAMLAAHRAAFQLVLDFGAWLSQKTGHVENTPEARAQEIRRYISHFDWAMPYTPEQLTEEVPRDLRIAYTKGRADIAAWEDFLRCDERCVIVTVESDGSIHHAAHRIEQYKPLGSNRDALQFKRDMDLTHDEICQAFGLTAEQIHLVREELEAVKIIRERIEKK